MRPLVGIATPSTAALGAPPLSAPFADRVGTISLKLVITQRGICFCFQRVGAPAFRRVKRPSRKIPEACLKGRTFRACPELAEGCAA